MAPNKKLILFITLILVVSSSLTVIALNSRKKRPEHTIFVSAASSLTDALGDIVNRFKSAHPEVAVKVSLGGSGYLATQIENGAPVDILISADERDVDRLIKQGLANPEFKSTICSNTLVLAGFGVQSEKTISPGLEKVLKSGSSIGIGNPDYVAAGMYTKALLSATGLLNKFTSSFIKGNSVRQVVGWLESGAVDYAFIYKTDAGVNPKIKILRKFSAIGRQAISYPLLLTLEGETNPYAHQFNHFLASEQSKTILEKYGFVTDRK